MARNNYGGKEDVMAIASHFVQDYYDKFAGSFSILQTMYGNRAKILVTGAASPGNPNTYDGQKEIAGHFEALGQFFTDQRKVCIRAVDAVAANYGSVVVTVEGSIYTPSADTTFSSVFVLQTNNTHSHTAHNSESFHICTEALHFNEETSNAPANPAAVPAAVPAVAANHHAQQAPIGVPAPRSAVAQPAAPVQQQRVAPAPVKVQPQPVAPAAAKVFEEDDEERRPTPPPQVKPERKEREPREKKVREERKPREEKKAEPVAEKKPVAAAAPAKKEETPKKKIVDAEEKKAVPAKKEGPKPNRFVVLRNVPKKTQIDDCIYYCTPFGKVKSTEWLGNSHAIVEFKYLAE
eukprot:252693_1